ncbi:MAG: single-stranded DNA-binding protein [Lewinellaceae bacterium]|nr:single-stranded DNA-binding protein [Lewinellaceae bacterium]
MKSLRNSVSLIGRLGADPELKKMESGNALTLFRLATSDNYRNERGEKVETTQWHSCIVWGKQAELAAEWLKKGKEVALRGRLEYREYTDKDGNKRSAPQIVVEQFIMTGNRAAS